jgi:Flp pilus assembly protein TadD
MVLFPYGGNADETRTEPLKVYIPNIVSAATLPDYFDAVKLEYRPELSRVTAIGKVEIAKDEKIVRADSIEYDQLQNRVIARGNIVILEPDGNVVFSDERELKSGIKESVISQFKEQMADNGVFMKAEEQKSAARTSDMAATANNKSLFGKLLAYILPDSSRRSEALQYAALAPAAGGETQAEQHPVIGNVPLIVVPDSNSPTPTPVKEADKPGENKPVSAPAANPDKPQLDGAEVTPPATPAASPAVADTVAPSEPAKAADTEVKENTKEQQTPAQTETSPATANVAPAPSQENAAKEERAEKKEEAEKKENKKPAKAAVKKKVHKQAEKQKEPPLKPLLDTNPAVASSQENKAESDSEPAESLSPKSREMLSTISPPASKQKPSPQKPFKVNHTHDMHDLFRADEAASGGQYEALGIKVEVKDPKINVDYELDKAYNAINSGQSEAAIEIYKNILSNAPNNTQALFGLATMYHRARQFDKARPLYRRLLLIDPQNRDGFNNFLVLLADEAPREALVEMGKLETANPGFSNIPAQMAVIYEKLGDQDKAIGKMFRAVELAPENLTYRYNLAIMLDKQKNYDEAAKLYRQLIEAAARGEKIPGNVDNIQQRLTFISSNRP